MRVKEKEMKRLPLKSRRIAPVIIDLLYGLQRNLYLREVYMLRREG
jgi:hypothetical protein